MNIEPQSAMSEHGLLLVGHGTRSLEGQQEFLRTVESVARHLPRVVVEPSFLELAEPTIDTAVERMARRGVNRLTVMPLLLFAAGHAKRDIPQEVELALGKTKLKQVIRTADKRLFQQISPLECHPKLQELSALRFNEAVSTLPVVASEETALVMVGRGSLDADATAEMIKFARLRGEQSPVCQTETGFVAMAEPRLSECLEQIAAADLSRIVIQPHLLFSGQLLEKISVLAGDLSRRHPTTQWIVARHLGPHALLDAAIVDLVTEELRSGGAEPIVV